MDTQQPMTSHDHYLTLGLAPTASHEEVRRAFVRLMKLHHPNGNGVRALSPDQLERIRQAYTCLHDPEKRARYHREYLATNHLHWRQYRHLQRRLNRSTVAAGSPQRLRRRSSSRRFWHVAAIGLGIALLSVWACQGW